MRDSSLLNDRQWEIIKPLLPKARRRSKRGRPRAEERMVLEGILWVLRSGARWRDLPREYPSASTCWRRRDQNRLIGAISGDIPISGGFHLPDRRFDQLQDVKRLQCPDPVPDCATMRVPEQFSNALLMEHNRLAPAHFLKLSA